MTDNPQIKLGECIRTARQKAKLSTHEVAREVGVNQTQIVRLEQGRIGTPNPRLLESIAQVLGLPLADLYAEAGYAQPTELPTLEPYLRTKYGELPEAARAELQDTFTTLMQKYGHGPNGPAPGEDEA